MKKNLIICGIAVCFLMASPTSGCFGQTKSYVLDTYSSKLLWRIKKTFGGGHNGFVLFKSGSLAANAKGQPQGGIFIIDMNTIIATDQRYPQDNRDVEGVIKAGNIFSVIRYPTATMKVSGITPAHNKDEFKVSGSLTIIGVTKPIQFMAILTPGTAGLKGTANLKINRTKWGITYQSPGILSTLKNEMIEDNIDISLNLVFIKK